MSRWDENEAGIKMKTGKMNGLKSSLWNSGFATCQNNSRNKNGSPKTNARLFETQHKSRARLETLKTCTSTVKQWTNVATLELRRRADAEDITCYWRGFVLLSRVTVRFHWNWCVGQSDSLNIIESRWDWWISFFITWASSFIQWHSFSFRIPCLIYTSAHHKITYPIDREFNIVSINRFRNQILSINLFK